MNRSLAFGIAMFFAIVGIALLGGEKQAKAGHGCHGCHSCDGSAGCDGGCGGSDCGGCHSRRCHGRCHGRSHGRCHGRHRCCGAVADCCGAPVCEECAVAPSCAGGEPSCAGGEAPVEAAPAEEAPPAPPATEASFRRVSFVR